MRYKLLLFFCCFLVLSGVTVWYVIQKSDDSKSFQHFTLSGQSELWEISNYQVTISSEQIERGHGQLVFLGESSELEGVVFFSVTVYEQVDDPVQGITDVAVLGNATSVVGDFAEGGSASTFSPVELGMVSGPPSPREQQLQAEDLESSYAFVTWQKYKQPVQEQRINLAIQ